MRHKGRMYTEVSCWLAAKNSTAHAHEPVVSVGSAIPTLFDALDGSALLCFGWLL